MSGFRKSGHIFGYVIACLNCTEWPSACVKCLLNMKSTLMDWLQYSESFTPYLSFIDTVTMRPFVTKLYVMYICFCMSIAQGA